MKGTASPPHEAIHLGGRPGRRCHWKGSPACVLLICTGDDPLEKEQDPRKVLGNTEMDKMSIMVGPVTPAGLLLPTLSLVSTAAVLSPTPSPQRTPQDHFPSTTG